MSVAIAGTPVPLMMPHPRSYYQSPNPTTVRLRADAVAAAEANGFANVQANYDREIILSTKVWGGAGNIGTVNQRTAYCSTSAAVVWAHELGHVNHFQHANLWQVTVPGSHPESAGSTIQYGDIYDTMGGSGTSTRG